jgi:CheY-like chemotaxis protein
MDKLVFIIDDDPVYLQFMQNHFKQMGGYLVEVFSNGNAALQQLETKNPFLIILDHHLNDPSGDGTHYLSLIKKQKPSIPVLYITSDNTEVLRKEVLKVGAKSLIVKSDSFLVQLRTAIDEIITSKNKGFFSKLFGS